MSDTLKDFFKRRENALKAKKSFNEVPLVPFDEVNLDDMYKGKCDKEFTRCLGWYLMDMVNEIKNNPSTNYVTCVDDIINDVNFNEGNFEKYGVSVVLKTPTSKKIEFAKNELIGSRVAEIFGVKTEYVAPIKNNKNKYLAVDFLSGDQQLTTFKEFVEKEHINTYTFKDGDCCIRHWINPLIKSAYEKMPIKSGIRKMMALEPLITDCVRMYILKKYIIHDADFCSLNMSVVYSPGYRNLQIAPAYDFEQSFMPGIRSYQGHGLEEDIAYLAKNYPSILEKVMNDIIVTNEKESKLKSVFAKFEDDKEKATELFNLVNNSVISFQGYSKKYLAANPRKHRGKPVTTTLNEADNIM